MKYYMHDSNSFQDEKITELFITYGYEGLGLFYTLLEKFALQEKPIKTSVLKKQLSVGKKLEKCWLFMERLELIYSNNGETFNENILKFTEKFQKDREKNANRIKEWREKQALTEDVTDSESVRNATNYTEQYSTELNLEEVEEAPEPFEILVNLTRVNHLKKFVKEKFFRSEEELKMKLTEGVYLERQEAFILRNNERSYTDDNDFLYHYRNFILKKPPEKEKNSGQKEKPDKITQTLNNFNTVQDAINSIP